MLLFVTVENKKCLNGSQIRQIEKNCIVGVAREEKSYFESKVFLVDNFWGQQ
jgi:hypothetical protein